MSTIDMKDLRDRASKITHVFLDVDGVLTDGRIIYGESGKELKYFDVKDGVGIKLAQRVNLEFVIITGRESQILVQRCEELGIHEIHQKCWNKSGRLIEILNEKKISPEQIAYMGDDIVDLPAMKKVGLAAAPSDSVQEIRDIAHFVTDKPGGYGAVRELIELILKSRGLWDKVLLEYTQ